jgi:large subunit ribosomal protein L35
LLGIAFAGRSPPLDKSGADDHNAAPFRIPVALNCPCVSRGGHLGAASKAVMPKMKTNKAASKRFKITGKGRVRRSKAGGNHGMQEKSRKRLRRNRNNDMVHKTMEKHVKKLLPYG